MTIRKQQRRFVALAAALGLVLAACGGDDGPDADGNSNIGGEAAAAAVEADDGEGDDHPTEFNFGEPADPADADRVIEITADDNFTFNPDEVEITAGETITFRVTNVGNLPHDFTLGDADLQDDHDLEMAEMSATGMGVQDDANAFGIAPGETKELTWNFTEAMDILMGCHIPGHYAAGMKGDIVIGA